MTVKDMEKMRKSELLRLAKRLKIRGFSRLTKAELVESIRSFITKGPEELLIKAKEIIASFSSTPKQVQAKKEPPPLETEQAPHAPPQKRPSMRVSTLTGLPLTEQDSPPPESTLDQGTTAKTKVEALRYEGDTLYQNGHLITPEELREIDKDLPDLPLGYGDGVIHLMSRDPRWLLCYWDISEEQRGTSGKYAGGQLYLKLHDTTHIHFDGTNSWSAHRFRLNEEARYWYLPVPAEGRRFLAELGYELPDGSWNSLGTSDGIVPPPSSQSAWIHDLFITLPFQEPLSIETLGEPTFWLGTQPLHSSGEVPQLPLVGTPVAPEPWYALEGAVTSPGGKSVSSFVTLQDERGLKESFPLLVEGDLRVYGAAEPHSFLTIDGKKTPLNPDGTFSLTIPLPDTDASHKVTAVGEKGERYSIVISIERNT